MILSEEPACIISPINETGHTERMKINTNHRGKMLYDFKRIFRLGKNKTLSTDKKFLN